MGRLSIANTVSDLIMGDVHEHMPLDRIPLDGDVLGLGTTTSLDNGELTFLHQAGEGRTQIWKAQAHDAGVRRLTVGDGSDHFPYVCFSEDMSGRGIAADLSALAVRPGERLQPLLQRAMDQLTARGALPQAPVYGVRLLAHWDSLIITVSSKLCLGEAQRNRAVARPAGTGTGTESMDGGDLYARLPHFRLARSGPAAVADPIRTLGPSLSWECCGFWDTEPERGRLTVPVAGAHLHLHGCSTDLRHGGHLRHAHPETALLELEQLTLYPLQRLHQLQSDLAVENLRYRNGEVRFCVANRGTLDVSDVGVAIVIDDCYSSHRYLRLPWMEAGASEDFAVPLQLTAGTRRLEVIADPEADILERPDQRTNNRAVLNLNLA